MTVLPGFLPSPLSPSFRSSSVRLPSRSPPLRRRNTPVSLIGVFNKLTIFADFTHPVAKGSFGEIFFGELDTGQPVVLKRAYSTPIARNLFRTERAINRKLDEAEVIPRYWPKYLGEYFHNSQTFLVWHRWEDALTLEDYIVKKPPFALAEALGLDVPREELSVTLFRVVVGSLLIALLELHGRKVVHRDVKPANVLVAPDAECPFQLIDFGSSCNVGRLFWGRGVDTLDPLYAAPEVRLSFMAPDKFDVFSVALMGIGVLVPEVATNAGMREFRRKLESCDFDLRKYRQEYSSGRIGGTGGLRRLFDGIDAETRKAFELLCGMLRKSPMARTSVQDALDELGIDVSLI